MVVLQTLQPLLNCPSRRKGGPISGAGTLSFYDCPNAVANAKGDYAVNAGDLGWVDMSQFHGDGGPTSLAAAATYAWPNPTVFDGISFPRSQVQLTDITNGTSNTFLLGEKYMNSLHYSDAQDPGDDANYYSGFDDDNTRCTMLPPHARYVRPHGTQYLRQRP